MKHIFRRVLKYIFRIRYNTKEFKIFRQYVISFYENYDTEYTFNSFRITKIRMYNYPRSVVIEINSLSPGMIIVVRGRTLDKFKSFIEKRYSKPVTVVLEESNPFK